MSAQGNNDYNSQKLLPSETIVSRTLQSKNRLWSNVVWRTGKPALDSEWNLINDMNLEFVSNLIRSKTPSGWLDLGNNKYSTNSSVANNFQFYSNKLAQVLDVPNAVVNGWPILVGGVNYTDTSINSIDLTAASTSPSGFRYDFAFLEVWRTIVRSRDSNNNPIAQNKPSTTEIYAYGNTQFGGTQFPDDIIDVAIKPSVNGIETSERVQIQYRIRVVPNVTFANVLSSGFETTAVQGQGANANPQVTGYQFTNMVTELNDAGLWRAGNGDQASQTALHSVDGYTYAIPMFKVYRRTQIVYSDTGATPSDAYNNQQGNSTDLASLISDRPDGKFYDGIDSSDITDLRLRASLEENDFDKIIEENLHHLLKGDLKSAKQQTLQYDSIADTDINGYTDFRLNQGCAGKRTPWSDAATDQLNIFARITTSTTSNALDVYVVKIANPNWVIGDQIIVHTTSKLPVGTIIKATPRLYVEQKNTFVINLSTAGVGTWSGLNTATATFTFTSNLGHNKNIWTYYDTSLPVGQGISYVPDEMTCVKYSNYGSFPTGIVVRGSIIESVPTRFQDLGNHCFDNENDTGIFEEVVTTSQRKQITLQPLIQSTSVRDGTTRVMDVLTTDATGKIIVLPFPIQHLKGIYTTATGGTELATQTILNTQVSSVDDVENSIMINLNYFIAELTSLKYDATSAFIGGEVELLVAGGGLYKPVYTHMQKTAEPQGSVVKLYKTTGEIFDIPGGSSPTNFRWSGRRTEVRGGSGYGYDLNNQIVDCTLSDNNSMFSGFVDGQQLWIDMDYLGAPHNGAEIRLIYKHTPYQGLDVGGQEIEVVHKRNKGIFMNNGTGGGTISITDTSGTSNIFYTPMSPRLPGSFNDYLRDGLTLNIGSIGTKRYDSDAFFFASYDLYGLYGGGLLWQDAIYTMPSTPEITSRGFLGSPILDAVFETPTTDRTYAEFILPLLVVNRITKEVYLCIQMGRKGLHKQQEGNLSLELYRLNEKLLVK